MTTSEYLLLIVLHFSQTNRGHPVLVSGFSSFLRKPFRSICALCRPKVAASLRGAGNIYPFSILITSLGEVGSARAYGVYRLKSLGRRKGHFMEHDDSVREFLALPCRASTMTSIPRCSLITSRCRVHWKDFNRRGELPQFTEDWWANRWI